MRTEVLLWCLVVVLATISLTLTATSVYIFTPLEQENIALQAELIEARHTCPENKVCYEPYGAPVQAQYILQGGIVRVDFVDASQMPDGVEAYSQWEADFDNNIFACIIVAQFPEQILGDPKMDALGHELLHCLTGNFHQ